MILTRAPDIRFETKVSMTSLMLNSIKNNLSMFKNRAAISGRLLIYSCIVLFSCVSLVIARERNSSPIKPCLLPVPLSSVELCFAVCCHVRHTKLCRVAQWKLGAIRLTAWNADNRDQRFLGNAHFSCVRTLAQCESRPDFTCKTKHPEEKREHREMEEGMLGAWWTSYISQQAHYLGSQRVGKVNRVHYIGSQRARWDSRSRTKSQDCQDSGTQTWYHWEEQRQFQEKARK